MHLRTHFLYLTCALTLTSPLYGSHSELIKASKTQDREQQHHIPFSKTPSLAMIGVGLATTAAGYAWYLGTSWAEGILCQDRMEPCIGNETYKPAAQELLKVGITVTTAGGIFFLHDLLADQNKK